MFKDAGAHLYNHDSFVFTQLPGRNVRYNDCAQKFDKEAWNSRAAAYWKRCNAFESRSRLWNA